MLRFSPKTSIMTFMNKAHYNSTLVKRAREDAGLKTQSDVASIFKVSEKTISRVESGRAASYELLSAMAKRYNADIRDWLVPTVMPQNRTSNVDKDIACLV